MADFTDVVDADPSSLVDELPPLFTPDQHPLANYQATSSNLTASVFQRVYDAGNNLYVYYTQSVANPTPNIGDTTPNHSGTLDTATHEVIKEN